MKEIARKHFGYILYEVDNKYLLSTICGTVGLFTVDFFLSDQEKQNYQEKGLEFIDKLAGDVVRSYNTYWHRCIITYAEYIMFGIFNSESIDEYAIYKLDRIKLERDYSNSWHNERFTKQGYVFKSEQLDDELFQKYKDLIYSIPQEIYKCNLKSHDTPDNSRENKIIIEFKCNDNIYRFTIDIYDELNTQGLTDSVKSFASKLVSAANGIAKK